MGKFSGTDGVGIFWIARDDYARYLSVMADKTTLPSTFNAWQKRANEAIALIEREGGRPVRIKFDADKFIAYCTVRGLRLDSSGRQMFAADPSNWPASEKH